MYKVVEKKYLPNQQGFTLDHKISEYELLQFRDSINTQWLEKIKEINPKLSNKIVEDNISIQDYHQISDYLEHEEIWRKSSRILPLEFVNWFIDSEFAKSLRKKYGEFEISDEDNLGWPNIYWRLVRPSKKSDIGPLHRDSWFWQLNENFPKPKYSFFRLKVWIPIYTELGLNGLLVEPFSQLREDIEWDGEIRHGIKKPILITPNEKLNPILIKTNPGNSIVFNDNLIHGGALNIGKKSRISIEFTMLVKDL